MTCSLSDKPSCFEEDSILGEKKRSSECIQNIGEIKFEAVPIYYYIEEVKTTAMKRCTCPDSLLTCSLSSVLGAAPLPAVRLAPS